MGLLETAGCGFHTDGASGHQAPTRHLDHDRRRKDEHMLSGHRIDVTYGLYALKNFLADNPISIPLNEASRNEIRYCVLQKDQVKARAEYEDIRDRLKACAGSEYAADFEEIARRYATSTHHTAALVFGAGTVEYSVLWIEKDAEVTE